METPSLPLSIFEKYFDDVYEPSEDTFILLDALEKELNVIKKLNPVICLEIGSGSGTVITSLAKALGPINCLYLVTDLNPKALECTMKCFEYNILAKQKSIYLQMIRGNLSEPFRCRMLADIILFNPPYVPTDENDKKFNDGIEASWAGGNNGRTIIDQFIKQTLTNELSPNGLAYLVVIEQNNIDDIINLANNLNLNCQTIIQRKCGLEKLSVLKFQYKSRKVS